jgi:hypothetical protein
MAARAWFTSPRSGAAESMSGVTAQPRKMDRLANGPHCVGGIACAANKKFSAYFIGFFDDDFRP